MSIAVANRRDGPRIMYVQTATNPVMGADAWVLVQLVRHLDRRTHEVYAACHCDVGGVVTPVCGELADLDDIELVQSDFGPELSHTSGRDRLFATARSVVAMRSLVTLARTVRRHRIQVVHAGDRPRDALATVLVARLTGAVSLVHVHQVLNPWWTRLLRWSVRRADVVIGVSEFVSASLRDGGIEPTKVRTLPNAIDPERWVRGDGTARRAIRSELGIDAATPVVLTVCRLFPGKGVADIVRALAGVRTRVSNATLIVAGSDVTGGAYSAELTGLVDQLDLGHAVHFLGQRADVADLMDAADVFAMPSRAEPFGLVYLEAMAKELPVVALQEGGALEIIVDGETGLLSDAEDLAALEANIVVLLDDPDLRHEMGRRGRKRVEAHFTLDQQAALAADLYRELTARS